MTFSQAMDQSRRVRALVVVAVLAVGVGGYRVVYGSGVFRLSGLTMAAFGVLLVLALVFWFERPGLADPSWSTTWPRKVLRWVLLRFWWWVGLVLAAAVAIAALLVWSCAVWGCT